MKVRSVHRITIIYSACVYVDNEFIINDQFQYSHLVCGKNTFRCETGGCIFDDSDKCSPDSPCIPQDWRCTGVAFCTDGSDEKRCNGNNY